MRYDELVRSVGEDRYRAACEWAWRTAAGTGTHGHTTDWPDDLAMVPHEFSNAWYDETVSLAERLDIALRLYVEMPSYGSLMYTPPFVPSLDAPTRERLWEAYRSALESPDDRLADPVGYALWVDYFEDTTTVGEAWHAMTVRAGTDWERRIQRVLKLSGPVPWSQKSALLNELTGGERWHPWILSALIGGAIDTYGQLDAKEARHLLRALSVDERTAGLAELRMKLGMGAVPRGS